MPQRDEASPFDHQQPAIAGGARRFGRIALDPHDARHHVLGNADPGMAMDDDLGFLVHAAAIEADMALDLDGERPVEAAGDGMLAHRIVDQPMPLIGVLGQPVQTRIDAAHALSFEIELDHAWPPQV